LKRVVAVAAFAVAISLPRVPEVSASSSIQVDPQPVAPGATVNVTSGGFGGGESVSAFFDSSVSAAGPAADDGSVEMIIPIPADAATGAHWITLIGDESHAWAQDRVVVSRPASTDVTSVRRGDGTAWTPTDQAGLSATSVDDLERVWRTSLDRTDEGATYPESFWGGSTYGQETSIWAMVDGIAYATWHASYRREDGTDHERTVVAAIDVVTGDVVRERTFDAPDPVSLRPTLVAGLPSSLVLSSSSGWPRRLLGIDANAGEDRWTLRADPVVASDGQSIVAPVFDPSFEKGVYAIDPSTGEQLWRLVTDRAHDIGEAGVIDDGVVVLERMVRPGTWTVATFEPTGDERWAWTRSTGADYGLVMIGGHVVSGSGTYRPNRGGRITALDLATGEITWTWDYEREGARTWVWATPIGATPDLVFAQAARCNQLEECDGTVEIVALSVEDGRVAWTYPLDEPTGAIAVAADVLALDGGRVLLDAGTGARLRTLDLSFQAQPFPVHPGAPILADGRMITTTMDSVVLFEVRRRVDRPDVEDLIAALPTPPASAPTQTGAGAAGPGAGDGGRWVLPAVALVLVLVGAISLLRGRGDRGLIGRSAHGEGS
jgi:outer membrane protein assembly factor BamB